MEWGTFITVIITIYLAWYGFNFLFDLFLTGKPKVETESAVHYQVSDLMAEEEGPRQVLKKDFEEKPVRKAEPATPQEPASADSTGQSIGTPAPKPAPQPSTPQPEADDWASVIDQEEEKGIDLPVQGQSISVSAFIQTLKDEAKLETSSIAF